MNAEQLYHRGELIEARARRTIKGAIRNKLMDDAIELIRKATDAVRANTARIRADLARRGTAGTI